MSSFLIKNTANRDETRNLRHLPIRNLIELASRKPSLLINFDALIISAANFTIDTTTCSCDEATAPGKESLLPGSKPHAAMYVHFATLIFSIFLPSLLFNNYNNFYSNILCDFCVQFVFTLSKSPMI